MPKQSRGIRFEEYAASKFKPPQFSAARSHEQNDAYMNTFDEGFEALQGKKKTATTTVAPAKIREGDDHSPNQQPSPKKVAPQGLSPIAQTWYTGPTSNPNGTLCNDVSAQPLVCMSICKNHQYAVVGSTDHALYIIDIKSGKKVRTLYTKRTGHSEWVTSVTHLSDGRVVSGAMDSKLCVWGSGSSSLISPTACVEVTGHTGSISRVVASPVAFTNDYLFLSASYDKTIRVWGQSKRSVVEKACLKVSGGAPILDLELSSTEPYAMSGDRAGTVALWDIARGNTIRKIKNAHAGHVTVVSKFSDLFITGGQDGHIRLWDPRASKGVVADLALHSSSSGTGALSGIESSAAGIVTAGADNVINVVDTKSLVKRARFNHHKDFIYSLCLKESVAFSGAGDGMLLCHDIVRDKLCYGLSANKAAVRCIGTTDNSLVAAGDDGSAIIYDMN